MIFRNKRVKILVEHNGDTLIEVYKRDYLLFSAISRNEEELGEDISDVRKILQKYSKTALRWFNRRMRK